MWNKFKKTLILAKKGLKLGIIPLISPIYFSKV